MQHPENEPKKIETPKQDGSSSVTPRQAIQVSKEKETTKENKEKGFKKMNVVDMPCESNINNAVKKHFSPGNT